MSDELTEGQTLEKELEVLEIIPKSKGKGKWIALKIPGKDGTTYEKNIMDKNCQKAFTGPGKYKVKMQKQGDFVNVVEVLSGPSNGVGVIEASTITGKIATYTFGTDNKKDSVSLASSAMYAAAHAHSQTPELTPEGLSNKNAAIISLMIYMMDQAKKFVEK